LHSNDAASERPEPRLLVDSRCLLGEGPLWSPEEQTLFWVDIDGHRLWRLPADGAPGHLPLPGPPGFLARGPRGKLVAGMHRSFVTIDIAEANVRVLGDPLMAPTGTMMNDGKADRQGRVVAGSKHLDEAEPLGRAFQLASDGVRPVLGGFTVFNGPAFSPEGTRIYFADSPSKIIRTARYDAVGGEIGRPEVFVELDSDQGFPDGMTVDSEGALWNAEWDGGRVTRYRADGRMDFSVALPVPRPTSVAFGGDDLRTLFVTSARVGLSDAALAEAPLSGGLFALRPGVAGLAESPARLPADPVGWSDACSP